MQAPIENIPTEALQLFQRGKSLLETSPPRTEEALECFEDAARICRRAGARYSYATTLNNIGFLYSSIGKKPEARNYYEQALTIFKAEWARTREAANTLHNLGSLMLESPGMHMIALRNFQAALTIDKELDPNSSDCGRDLDGMAAACELDSDIDNAIKYFEEAMDIQRRCLASDAFKKYLSHLADLCARVGDHGKAATYRNSANQIG